MSVAHGITVGPSDRLSLAVCPLPHLNLSACHVSVPVYVDVMLRVYGSRYAGQRH